MADLRCSAQLISDERKVVGSHINIFVGIVIRFDLSPESVIVDLSPPEDGTAACKYIGPNGDTAET